jgi:hypothetical protein
MPRRAGISRIDRMGKSMGKHPVYPNYPDRQDFKDRQDTENNQDAKEHREHIQLHPKTNLTRHPG